MPIEGWTPTIAPEVSGEMLRPLIEANGDLRMHVSNGAATSFVDTLPLLHAQGFLCCHDLFVTDIHQYLTGFRGPGKYDGSVVNWVNGPLSRPSAGGMATTFASHTSGIEPARTC